MIRGFYFDEHVPRAIALALRLRGIAVTRVQQDGRAGVSDPELMDRACELGLPLVSQDEDLLVVARQRQATGQPFPGLIYAHQLNISVGRCVKDLELIARLVEPEELADRVEYLPL